MVKAPAVLEEKTVVNWPLEFVFPEVELSEPPLLLKLIEAPEIGELLEVTVTVIVEDCSVLTLVGFAIIWTESVGGAFTVRVTAIMWSDMPPPEPLTYRVWLPEGAEEEALTVNVDEKVGEPEVGLKLQLNQLGGLSKERETPEGDPLCREAVTVYDVDVPPAVTVRLVGDAERRKSFAGASTTREKEAVAETLPQVPVTVIKYVPIGDAWNVPMVNIDVQLLEELELGLNASTPTFEERPDRLKETVPEPEDQETEIE
jgi:hypothetical protein